MRLLLTSGGVSNDSILIGLKSLLEKPIDACNALCITTASFGYPNGHEKAYDFIMGKDKLSMCGLGWKSLGILELGYVDLEDEMITKSLRDIDVILVNGGHPNFLYEAMKKSHFMNWFLSSNKVYVGLSAGSMVMTPHIGKEFSGKADAVMYGLVPISIFPHLNHPDLPNNNIENATKWSKQFKHKSFAMDDSSAILVQDDKYTIITEGLIIPFEKKSEL